MRTLQKRKYKNPPIVEALCEIYFRGSKWDQTIPGLFYEKIKAEFPNKSELKGVNVHLQVKDGAPRTLATEAPLRQRFSAQNNSKMVQVGENLLVINQLQPYPNSFEDWKPKIFEMLTLYRDLVSPESIEKIGVRFINKIKIPETNYPMEKYFQIYPKISTDLAAFHGDFLMRLKIPPPNQRHELLLTFSTTPKDEDGRDALLLDIYDVVNPASKDVFSEVKKVVDEAHSNVEHAFEKSISDEARNLFQEVK